MLYLPKEQGQSRTEYALALAGIALVVISILMLLGPAIVNALSGVVSNLRALPP
jgi:Flp pilus assembly pilin Flp